MPRTTSRFQQGDSPCVALLVAETDCISLCPFRVANGKVQCFTGVADDLNSADKNGLDYQECEILVRIRRQSPDTAGGADVNKDDLDIGTSNQGIMFECETEDATPLTHLTATRLRKRLSDVRKNDRGVDE